MKIMTFWFTGLPSSGKTTLAFALQEALSEVGYPVVVLDGDIVRKVITADLGYSVEDRLKNISRAAGIAELLNDQEIIVISSFITPTTEIRDIAQKIIGPKRFNLVYLKCSIETCSKRDVKGLYKADTKQMTGISQGFDDPSDYADFIVDTENDSIDNCLVKLFAYVTKKCEDY